MQVKKFHRVSAYLINAILLINLLSPAFLPTYVMAQAISEEDERRIQQINRGQWDGALGVKNFTLPSVDNSPISTTNPVTGEVEEHTYQQSDGTYNFSSIKMGDMFQGFSQAQHEAYAADLEDIRDNPHQVQDSVYQMQLDKTTFADVECSSLTSTDEQQRCELAKQASLLDDMRGNTGAEEFLGAEDSILTDFSSIADGTHPYYAELQNEECVETVQEGEDGEGTGLIGRHICLVGGDAPEQVCRAERYLKSTKVNEKVVIKYPIDSEPSIDVVSSGFDAYDIRNCPGFQSTRRTCLEIDVLTTTQIDRVATSAASDEYIRAQLTLSPPGGSTLYSESQVIRNYAVRSDFLAPNMTLPSNLGDFIDSPEDYVVSPETNLLSMEFGYRYFETPNDWCHPLSYMESDCPPQERFVDGTGTSHWGNAYNNADIFRESLSEDQMTFVNPPHTIVGNREEYLIEPVEHPRLDQSFDNTRAPYTVSEDGEFDVGSGSGWMLTDSLDIHGYYPKIINVTDHTEYPSDDLVYYSFHRIQVILMGQISTDTPVPPDPVDDSNTIIKKVLIDDLDTYPRVESFSVLGAPVEAEVTVFDQGTYGVDEYFPTNIRVVGDTVESYTLKTIGRPTDRYEYELEIEFSGIAPFEVIADIHRIDEQGFRPKADEDPNCQTVIDLYTSGTVDGTAVCDYVIDNDESLRISDDGVPIDWPHVGYFGFMPEWTPDGMHGLPNFCYDATINVDPSDFGGFASLDREVACAGLPQADYDACMNGQYCEYNAVTGGTTCLDIGEDLRSSFEDSCAAFIEDESCEHKPEETRCEESLDRDGETVCLYESHVFECVSETQFSTPGTNDSTEIDCGTPRDCINGECNNLADESNDAFLRATAAMQILQEAKDNKCVVGSDGEINESSCKLFSGKATRCKTPTVWGAQDCCNPDDLGMGGMDIVAYWQMYKLLDELDERVNITGYMSEAWGAVQQTADGTALGNGMGAMSEFIQGVSDTASTFGADAYSFVTKPIVAGWESTFKTLGFDPEGEVVGIAADYFDVGTAVAGNAGAAAETTRQSAEVLANTAPQSAGIANATVATVGEEEAIGGMYKYLANGINNFLLENGFVDTANAIFVTGADGSIGFNTGTATGEFLNTAANIFGWIMLAYTIYNVYNLAVGIAFACDEEDFETTQKIKLLSTHYVGSWCSKKLFIGGCIEYSQGHCTYPSVFSRIISEEFRRIMAEDNGVGENEIWLIDPTKKPKPENLACNGFTLDEVANINWDRVDLSEYENIVLATLKYDPNNMPEDFVKSDYMVTTQGPQAGQTLKDSGSAQAAIVAHASEQAKEHMNPADITSGDPDFMPWYAQGSAPESNNCLISCDTAGGFFYDSDSSLCVSEEKVPYPASFTCDSGAGYTLFEESPNNFTCQKTQTVPLTTGCRAGFIEDEITGLCTKDAIWFEEKITSCPDGYRLSNQQDSCDIVITTPKVTNCSAYGPGFVLIDNVCQQSTTETAPPFFACSSDEHIIEDGECVLRTEIAPVIGCNAPLVYDEDADACVEVSYDTIPATFSCESYGPEYELNFGDCVKRTVTTGTLTCDDEYTLVDGECQHTYNGVFDATTTCPDTYMADPEDTSKCFKRTQTELRPDPYCEDSSFTLIDNSYCQKVISESLPPVPVCLNSFEYDEDSALCIKVTRYPPTINCSSSDMTFDDLTGLCRSITEETVPPSYICNEGDSLVDGQCVTHDTAGYSLSCLEDHYYNVETDTCILQDVESKAPSYWCPIGTTKSGDQCLQYDFAEPLRSCEPPKVLNADTLMCEETVTLTTTPSVFCPIPSYMDHETGLCMIDEVIPADIACPVVDGTPLIYNSDSELCEREITVEEESVYICPPDEVECNTADERDPVPQCINGSFNLETGQCEDFNFTYPDAIAFCEDSTHVYNAATNRCELTSSLSATKCGPPLSPYFFYEPISQSCQHENIVGQIEDCVAGFVFDGESCVSTTHSPMTCHDPDMVFDTNLDRCVKTTIVEAVIACQSPYIVDPLDSSQCVLPPSHEPICSDNEYVPVGFDSDSGRCRHLDDLAQHDAYLVCPPGSINQDNQYCYSGRTTTPSCEPGFTFNASNDKCEFTPTLTWYCTGDTVLVNDPITNELQCIYEEERRPVCADSSQYYDTATNRCVTEEIVQGTMICNDEPPFYRHLDGTQCITVARVPYESPGVCEDGYYPYNSELCEAQLQAQPPEFNCPSGFERNMSEPVDSESPRCVKYTDVTPECDVGYSLEGNHCTNKFYAYEPIERCLYQGQTLFGDACSDGIQSVAPTCPSGYTYSPTYDECIELTEVGSSQSCMSANFTLDTDSGKCNSTYDEAPTCLQGYQLNSATNLCEQIEMAPICDEANGFFYDTDTTSCKKVETEPANFYCDGGERDDGDGCTPITTPTCAEGFIFEPENDRCFKQVNQPHEPNCGVGEVDYNGECIEEDAVDCSFYDENSIWDPINQECVLTEVIPHNPDGCEVDQVLIDGQCYDLEALSCPPEAPTYNVETKVCEGVTDYSGTPYCEEGRHDSGSGCSEVDIPTCSPGLTFNTDTNICVDISGTTPVEVCEDGDTDSDPSNGCTTTDTDSSYIECDSGYTYNSSENECQKTVNKECSEGSLQSDGSCQTNHGEITYSCDANKYSPAVGSVQGSNCKFVLITEDMHEADDFENDHGFTCVFEAEPGFVFWQCDKLEPRESDCDHNNIDGQCVETFSDAVCPSDATSINTTQCRMTDTPTCDGEYTWTGTTCTSTFDNGSHALECPVGESLEDGLCYLPDESPLCGEGYYFDNATAQCLSTSEHPYEFDCGDDQHVGEGVCEREESELPICSDGFTFEPSQNACLSDAGEAQTYSCPIDTPSYTHVDETCVREIIEVPYCSVGSFDSVRGTCTFNHHPYAPNCNSPFVDANGQCEQYFEEPPLCPTGYPDYNPGDKTCNAAQESYNYDCNVVAGFLPVDGDITQCERITFESYECPLTSQFLDTTDHQCKENQYTSKTNQCDSLGYGSITVSGNCETYYEQGFVTCESGYRVDYDVSRDNLVCHKEQNSVSTDYCPFGYTNDGGVCVELTSNDVDYSCEPGWSLVPTSSGFECRQFTGDIYPNYECLDPSNPLFDTEACRTQTVTEIGEVTYTCQGPGYIYHEEDGVCRLPTEGYPVNEYCADPTYTLVPLNPEDIEPNGREYKCVNTVVETEQPLLSCPDASPAFELRLTGNCVRSEPTTSIEACGDGYTLSDDGSVCERDVLETTSPDIACSEPYSESAAGGCVLVTSTSASQTCDPINDVTGECSMEIDGSMSGDQYGVFTSPVTLANDTPFEITMMASCLEIGKPCVFLGNDVLSEDAIYIPSTASSLTLLVSGTAYQYPLGDVLIAQSNQYKIIRDRDNIVSVRINGNLIGEQIIPSPLRFEWIFRHNGLGEHSKMLFNSASIANYSTTPQQGNAYTMSCTPGTDIIEDINLDNDINLVNVPLGGGPLSPYEGESFGNNAPPLPITESDWDLVYGVCEKVSIIAEVPPILTCDGEENAEGECLSPSTYPPTPSCDTDLGYEYNSLTFNCERTTIVEEAPDSYTCNDSSHVLYDGMCQYSEGILPEGVGCNEGYEYDEDSSSCKIYQVITDQAVLCEDGDEQRFNQCYEREYIDPLLECPTNSVEISEGLCQGTYIDRQPPNVSCDAGVIVGQNCVETDTQEAVVSCSDSSYELLNNVCYKDIILSSTPPSLSCLPNHTLETDGLCHFESISAPTVECPDIDYSYNSTTNSCEKTDTQNYHPDLGCPTDGLGWVSASSTMCERVTSSVPVDRQCEDPSADDSGEQCRFEDVETHEPGFCASPYSLDDGQCKFYEYEKPIISCPDIENVYQTANGCMEVIRTTQAPVTDC